MQLLRIGTRPFVTLVAAIALTAAALSVAGHPTHEPDHGVDEETACTLWSGDTDETNRTEYEDDIDDSVPELCLLAPITDIPLDEPPAAVEQWNRGDHRNFPTTGADRSVYPRHANRSDGLFVADAHATIFAIEPSTRARLSPTDQPRYVATNGSVLGTVDYRVDVPPDNLSLDRRVTWTLLDDEITRTRLRVDGRVEATDGETHTPLFDYDLSDDGGDTVTFTIEADVEVELSERIEICVDLVDGTCTDWNVTVTPYAETVTVTDTVDVVEYDLAVSGYRASFPNGDLGVVVYKNHPWLGHDVPGGDVRGVWRFYSARDPRWDELVTATDHDTSTAHSPLHPLTITAFPVETNASVAPHPHVTLVETIGVQTAPPGLPAEVDLDVIASPYTTSYGLATRTNTTDHDVAGLTAHGLVRGVTSPFDRRAFTAVPIYRTALSLDVVNSTDDTTTIRIGLHDEAGMPIETATREGYVTIGSHRVNTSADGTVTITVPRGDGGLSARFVPGTWWLNTPSYVGSSDVVYVRGGGLAVFAILFEFAVPTSLFLLAVFFVDRITDWRIWPPWRRL